MGLYSIMMKLITLHNDCKYCGRSQAIAGVIINHHISQNSLMYPFRLVSPRVAGKTRVFFTMCNLHV